ncbi:efflux RND transporter periplasmic adaptor subunit [Nitratidesulfovibrio sp. 1201_IL3209]|uniref:efflux RND transporter periplasmic adaptor subunit n=1 Tax=Nitratidesulfovibrio sp. 1201_IL3209 TaxID=3084053 RepID=UPI002FD910FC
MQHRFPIPSPRPRAAAAAMARPLPALHMGLFALVLALAAVLTGCKDESAAPKAAPAPLVVVQQVQPRDLPLTYEYVGQTAGSREVEVRARVGGILLRRAYAEGRPVKKGDLMFEIDPEPFKADLDQALGQQAQAEARLQSAQSNRDRVLPLYRENAVSQKDRDDAVAEFDSARAALEEARARVKTARINLGYTRVEAPISGMTSKETRSEGSLVTTTADGSLLTTISKVDPVYVNYSAPSVDLFRLRRMREEGKITLPQKGYDVTVRLIDGSTYKRTGTVNFIDPLVDPLTGTIRVRAEFPNPEAEVLPGQFVRVIMTGAVYNNALAIPQRAVLQTQQGPMVWVIGEGDVAQPRPVEIGLPIGNEYIVEKGLAAGERYVVEGLLKVRPGQPVTIGQPREAQPGQNGQSGQSPAGNATKAANQGS